MITFAAVIAIDRLLAKATHGGFGVADEVDALHQAVALGAAGNWVNEVAIREWYGGRAEKSARRR